MVRQIHQNEKVLLKEIYIEYYPDVFRYANSILQDKDNAQDITGDTFLKVIDKVDQIDFSSKEKIKFLLIKICRNLIIDKFKSKKLQIYNNTFEHESSFDKTEGFLDELIHKDLLENVKKYVLKLSSFDQEIINLRIWQELPFEQIAKIQERDVGACKMHFYRAINKVRNNFKGGNYA